MSPARKTAKKATTTKASRRKATKAQAPKAAAKTSPKGKTAPKGAKAVPAKRHCAATDPFGDPCQSVPRLPSKYCVIHSFLER